MKYAAHKAFEKHLEASAPNHFASAYMILAKDAAERKLGLELLLKALRQHKEPTIRSYQGDAAKVQDLLRDLDTYSFFAQTEVIVIHQADELAAEVRERLIAFMHKPSAKHILVLVAEALAHTTNLYKIGEKQGIVLEIAEEKPWEKEKSLAEWLTLEAQKEGKRIDAQAMVKQVGLDRGTLQQELEKLFCYVGDRSEITVKDMQALCPTNSAETEWKLGEALFRRDGSSALAILHSLMEDANAFFPLMRQLRTQFQTTLQVASILAEGGRPEQVTQVFPYMKGTILSQKIQQAQTFGCKGLKKGIQLIDEAELSAKNGREDQDLLAELLIIKLMTENL